MKKRSTLRSGEAYPIIARYFKSGLRPHEFYKKEGWSDNQFSYWKKRYMAEHNMHEHTEEPLAQFYPIDVINTIPQEQEQVSHIELEYPNGVVLRINGKFDDLRIAGLIKIY
jgi:hypothetical protein